MITFIVNPAARHGRVRRMMPRIEHAVKAARTPVAWHESKSAQDCVDLAKAAAAHSSTIVAVGGDGTVNLVASGILASERRPPMAVIPLGTGNDFAHMVAGERRVDRILAGIDQAGTLWVDYGTMRWEDRNGECRRFFFNAAGLGFDGATNIEAVRFKMLPGSSLGYLVAVLSTLRRWTNPMVRATWTRADGTAGEYEGSLLLANAANGKRVGGGFYLTPNASIVDGALDLCLVRGASAGRVLQILPLALRSGPGLARQPEVIAERVVSVEIQSERMLPVHCDGEIVSDSCRVFGAAVVPAGLEIRVVPTEPAVP